MANYPIVTLGNPVLRSPCDPVTDFGPALSGLVDDLFAAMYRANGVGLAANQVGVGLRVFVYDCPDDDGVRHVGHVVNPGPVETGGELIEADEGCLSLPDLAFSTPRWSLAVVDGVDRDGRRVRVEGTGYFARCLQHETDHLNGRVYVDLLAGRLRREALRAVREATWT
ncbi:MAG TPA: peptide deformylase [Mycobacteriales bacterium]|nr:peptide deformylase [Mycobacteriales bacterium]